MRRDDTRESGMPGAHVPNEDREPKHMTEDPGPAGQTGIADLRDASGEHGDGSSRDPMVDRTQEGDLYHHDSAAELRMERKDPTGDDGPSYERCQWPRETPGGSTDPHDTLSHSDSGDETE